MTLGEIVNVVKSLTEAEAKELVYQLEAKHDWRVTLLSRESVDDRLGRPITDEEWERILMGDHWSNRWIEGEAEEEIRDGLRNMLRAEFIEGPNVYV